jgi:hypothetical protein
VWIVASPTDTSEIAQEVNISRGLEVDEAGKLLMLWLYGAVVQSDIRCLKKGIGRLSELWGSASPARIATGKYSKFVRDQISGAKTPPPRRISTLE